MISFFAKGKSLMSVSVLLVATLLCVGLKLTAAQIGVCYGADGNNLPSKQEVIDLYKSVGISRMRIYNPDEATLQALRGSNIELILGVPNDSLQSLTNAGAASDWVQKYVTPTSAQREQIAIEKADRTLEGWKKPSMESALLDRC